MRIKAKKNYAFRSIWFGYWKLNVKSLEMYKIEMKNDIFF